jgi:hypothetical protein
MAPVTRASDKLADEHMSSGARQDIVDDMGVAGRNHNTVTGSVYSGANEHVRTISLAAVTSLRIATSQDDTLKGPGVVMRLFAGVIEDPDREALKSAFFKAIPLGLGLERGAVFVGDEDHGTPLTRTRGDDLTRRSELRSGSRHRFCFLEVRGKALLEWESNPHSAGLSS